jgi:hypothetical protein
LVVAKVLWLNSDVWFAEIPAPGLAAKEDARHPPQANKEPGLTLKYIETANNIYRCRY